MYTKTLIAHPAKLRELELQKKVAIISEISFGSLGLKKFALKTDEPKNLGKLQAHPYNFVFSTPLIDAYSMDDCLSMLGLFLRIFAGEYPISFEVQKFLDPPTTHIYPTSKDDYVYVCTEQRKYLDSFISDVHELLGFRAVTHDPLCWINMQISRPIMWQGGCIVRSEDFWDDRYNISRTLRYMEVARRRGFSAVVTQDSGFEEGLIHGEMRYGPVVFHYDRDKDLQPISAIEWVNQGRERNVDIYEAEADNDS